MAQIHTNLFVSNIQVLFKALSSIIFFGLLFSKICLPPVIKKLLKTTQFFFKSKYLLISQQQKILTTKSFQIQCKSVDYHQLSLENHFFLYFGWVFLCGEIVKYLHLKICSRCFIYNFAIAEKIDDNQGIFTESELTSSLEFFFRRN
jgi:hypothetical protein